MLTAKEAKEMALVNKDNLSAKEIADLEKQINEAVLNGELSISNNSVLQDETVARLIELGYEVTTDVQYDSSYYTISWKN